MMKVEDFIKMLKYAVQVKSLYVQGGYGAPLTDSNKNRYYNNTAFNRRPARQAMVKNASADTFAFDCVCLPKGILWGWTGDLTKKDGGAVYGSNGVPDCTVEYMINACPDASTNFSNICPGEVLYMSGHIGVYIGEGVVIECTPIWNNSVQYSWLGNLPEYKKGHYRIWTKHGHLPWVDYGSQPTPPTPTYTQKQFITDVQKALKVPVDGIAGPVTLGATVTVSKYINTHHAVVLPMQKYLNALGFDVGTPDGWTGPKFDAGLKAFQKANGCVVDGEATAKKLTWQKLLGLA